MTSIKGALSNIYGALFPGQMRLNVPFGMRNPAVPRSLASVGARQGSPEAKGSLFAMAKKRNTLLLKPGKELFCPSCPSQGRKESVCPCEMGREIGNPVLSRRLDSSRVWQWVPCPAARARVPSAHRVGSVPFSLEPSPGSASPRWCVPEASCPPSPHGLG